jgi:hypothetical protein
MFYFNLKIGFIDMFCVFNRKVFWVEKQFDESGLRFAKLLLTYVYFHVEIMISSLQTANYRCFMLNSQFGAFWETR